MPVFVWYITDMKIVINTLVVIFFLAFVVPSFAVFFIELNKNVFQGEMAFKDFAGQTADHSYMPVVDFYKEKYEDFTDK